MKAVMSNQQIPVLQKIRAGWDTFKAHQSGVLGNVDSVIRDHKILCEIIEQYIEKSVDKISVLDLGCGQRATQTALFSADGASVTGVDYEIPTYKMGIKTFFKAAQRHGFERAIKAFIRHMLLDKKFFNDLASSYGKEIDLAKLDTRVMDASDLKFEDKSFDFIYSAWVFEHVENVSRAICEINRILKGGGVAWIGVHLFPSLSGGHNFAWARPDEAPSKNVPPWDHLLDVTSPVNTYLNKLRLEDYRSIFSKAIQVADEQLTFEGKQLLTVELKDKLIGKGYSYSDLTTRTVVFLCRKKKEG